MSLDRRLRDELQHDARQVAVDVEHSLGKVEARARRRSRIGSLAPLAAAAVVVVALAVRFGPLSPGVGGPSQRPIQGTSAPSPSPYICPSGHGGCLGPLLPGTYATNEFAPMVGYSVPAGWVNTLDVSGQFDLAYAAGGQYRYPDGLVFRDGISLFRRPVAESSTSQVPLEGVGKTAHDLALWLDGHVDLTASGLTPVTVGGAPGYRIDIAVPEGPRTEPDHCTTDHGEPRCVSLFVGDDASAQFGFGIVGPESAVIYLVDLPSGETVMIVIDDVDGVDRAGLIAAATPILNSLVFPGAAGTSSPTSVPLPSSP